MKLYAIDSYFYKYLSADQHDTNAVFVGSRKVEGYEDNDMVEVMVDMENGSWTSGERTYHGYKVESIHNVTAYISHDGSIQKFYTAGYLTAKY